MVLAAGTSFHFAAFLDSGIEAPVYWSLDDAAAGTITSDGTFTHNYCFSRSVLARARLVSDPSISATTRIQAAYQATAFIWLRSIELSNGQPASPDSLAGATRFLVGVDARPYPCRAVRKIRMSRLVNLDAVTVDSVLFDPPLETSGQQALSWQTATVANGRYVLNLIATRADGSTESSSFGVNVRNP